MIQWKKWEKEVFLPVLKKWIRWKLQKNKYKVEDQWNESLLQIWYFISINIIFWYLVRPLFWLKYQIAKSIKSNYFEYITKFESWSTYKSPSARKPLPIQINHPQKQILPKVYRPETTHAKLQCILPASLDPRQPKTRTAHRYGPQTKNNSPIKWWQRTGSPEWRFPSVSHKQVLFHTCSTGLN